MKEQTNKGLMAHDSDVAGSLLTLLGEDWEFLREDSSKVPVGTSVDSSSEMHLRLAAGGQLGSDNLSLGCHKLKALRSVLDKADEWRFDVFELERETDGLPLQVLAWHVLSKHKLVDEFNLDHVKLINFLRQVPASLLSSSSPCFLPVLVPPELHPRSCLGLERLRVPLRHDGWAAVQQHL
jgi:hypothetical protein